MTLPDPDDPRRIPEPHRPIVAFAVVGGGLALVAAIVGLVALGISDKADAQIASTGLATIGATLAGAFASWMGGGASRTGGGRRGDEGGSP